MDIWEVVAHRDGLEICLYALFAGRENAEDYAVERCRESPPGPVYEVRVYGTLHLRKHQTVGRWS